MSAGHSGDWIDVTRVVDDATVVWPGDEPFRLRRDKDVAGPDGVNVSSMSGTVHAGTHVDAPLHYFADGASVDRLPLAKLCGPALVIECPASRHIEPADFRDAPIVPGDRVLFKTANGRFAASTAFHTDFVALAADAAAELVRRGVALVGIDYHSVDPYDSPDYPAHTTLLRAGVILVENLDLSAVSAGRHELVALPLRLANADAAPARVIVRPA